MATFTESFPSDTGASTGWGANWLGFREGVSSNSLMNVSAGRGTITSAASFRLQVWNGGSVGAAQYSQANVYTADYGGVMVRASSVDGNTFYFGGPNDSATDVCIRKVVAGVNSIVATASHSHVSGDLYRLEANGTSLILIIAGSTVISTTDSSIASGQPGIVGYNSIDVDNWGGGDLAGASSIAAISSGYMLRGIR